jgi:iron complex outermembrane receptor protein
MASRRDGITCALAARLTVVALLGLADGAAAQTPTVAPVEGEAPKTELGEVVVTAQRRSESLKDVPISVQAISGDQLATQAVNTTSDLAAVSPTLNFSTGNSANASAFSLRGVSSLTLQNGIQPSTAMVVDGVAVARQAEFVSDLNDIDRIEILNGPQGTLFGKNSTAGVINIVTRQPTRKLEGMIESLATNDSEFGVRAMLNVPLANAVHLRMNGFYRDQAPLIRNLSGPDVLGAKVFGASLKLAVDITDNLNLLLAGTYSHTRSSGGQHVPVGPNIFGPLQAAVVAPAKVERGMTTINMNAPAVDLFIPWNVSGTLNWRLSDVLSLISISSFSGFSEDSEVSIDETPAGIIVGKGPPAVGPGYPFRAVLVPFRDRFPDRFHYFSHEDRINYNTGAMNAVLGVYYQDYRDAYALNLPFIFDGSLVGGAPGVPYYSNQYPVATIRDKTHSVFGDVTVRLPEAFDIFAGLRYTYEKINVAYHRDDFFGPASLFNPLTGVFAAPPVATLNTQSQHRVFNLSGRTGLEYKPSNSLNYYFSYSRGYKSPAVDVSQNLGPGSDPIIKPELATAYEVGSKLRLFENRLALNVAVFYEEIKGIQEGIIPPGIVFHPILINAGTLRTRGAEADARWAVTPELRLAVGSAYDKASYAGFHYVCTSTQLATSTCPNDPTPGFQDITGQQAIQSPRWKYSLSGDYSSRFPGSDLGYYLHVGWTWTDSIYYELGQDPVSREPAHGLLDASVGLKGPNDRWEIQAFGKNLTNRFYYSNLNNVAVVGRPIGYLSRDFTRYGGVRLTYRF